ncbi:MAG: hypothetical protein IPN26_13235 [Bacteroidetes bacterium]|nr:hypothetical protein [Bacteroidota bacterium]
MPWPFSAADNLAIVLQNVYHLGENPLVAHGFKWNWVAVIEMFLIYYLKINGRFLNGSAWVLSF